MATDEEYLDNLLKTMNDGGEQESQKGENGQQLAGADKGKAADEARRGKEAKPSDSDEWKSDLDDILALAGMHGGGDSAPNSVPSNETEAPQGKKNWNDIDFLDNMGNPDADMAEISGLLRKADKHENVDEDMLALLESANGADSEPEYDIFADGDLDSGIDINLGSQGQGGDQEDDLEDDPGSGKKKRKKKAKKEKKKKNKEEKVKKSKGWSLFGKRKQDGTEDDEETEDGLLPESWEDDGSSLDGSDEGSISKDVVDVEETEGLDDEDTDGKKHPGFFGKLLAFLNETVEAEEEEENEKDGNEKKGKAEEDEAVAALRELDEADRKKIKKEANKKEKKEKAAAAKQAKKKAKAPKKSPKQKKSPKEAKNDPLILLQKGEAFMVVALSATLLASAFILSTFLPDYADKQMARQAYAGSDYETVYKLLYGKNLSEDETLIYNKVSTVLELERRLESYENNMTLGRELEAVDALMRGVSWYHARSAALEPAASGEVDAIYQQICSVLLEKYGITQEEAIEINAYNNTDYTRRLTAMVNGTDFVAPGDEAAQEEPATPQDILPEEEELLTQDGDTGSDTNEAMPEEGAVLPDGSEAPSEDGASSPEGSEVLP